MNVATIPAELKDRPQWVVWRLEQRDGKKTKVPYRADGSGRASSTEAATWATFDAAVAASETLAADGVGFVFTKDDPFVGVDLDEGLSEPDRAAVMLALDSYTETSFSGNGAHVFVRATLNGHGRNRKGPFEVYEHGRYFCVTGAHVRGTPTSIEDRQAQLERVLDEFLPAPPVHARVHAREPRPVDLDDRDLLEKAMGARNGSKFVALWNGDTAGYPSQSEADHALCSLLAFWTGRDPDRVDRMFRASGLMREKWERADYRARTIDAAIAGTRDVYEPGVAEPDAPAHQGTTSSASERRHGPSSSSFSAIPIAQIRMRSIEWLEKPLWQRSAFQLLAGAKGTGKGTYLAGLAARISRTGQNVVFVSTEDSTEIDLKPRLVAAGADVDRCYVIKEHVRLPDDVEKLRTLAVDLGGVGLFVIDPVANHVGNRSSNDDNEVRDAIAPLNPLADELGCLLIGVRHPGKDRSRGAVASILGSTAWVDTPRAVVMIAVDDEDPLVRHIQVVAGNRSLNGSAQAFRIDAVDVAGLTEPITIAVELGESAKSVDDLLAIRDTGNSKTARARTLILDILDAEGGQESDTLDARVAQETGLAAKTVKNARTKLKDDGLVNVQPDKDEQGTILRWRVTRTGAPRP